MRTVVLWIVVALVCLAGGAALLRTQPIAAVTATQLLNQFATSGGPPVPIESADTSGTGPGSLVSATTMPGVTRTVEGSSLRAARVLYRSTSGDTGAETVVSGSVFTPTGDAPEGGWPIVALGHGTLGLDGECAPSLSPNLLNLINYVKALTNRGFAVAVPDYQGLGTQGIHPYPDSKTAGLNMIDAVRALRHTFGETSSRWAALGDSQGGGAAWAADEQAASYAPELTLVGAVASSPVTDVSGLVDKAEQGTLTTEQRPVIQAVIESLARLHPDLNRDDFREFTARQVWDDLLNCAEDARFRRAIAIQRLGPAEFRPHTPEAAARLRQLLSDWALPEKPLSAPLFVWYGGKDPFIDSEWTAAAIRRACELGGQLTIEFEPDGGHNPTSALKFIDWIKDRFDGKPAPDDC